eukprot:TCONS_00013794-protein
MKNLVTLAKSGGNSERKFDITKSVRKSKSISYDRQFDPFIEDINIKLQGFCLYTEHKPATKKIIHDCNSNNLSLTGNTRKSNLKRLHSWNKEFSKKLQHLEENLPKSDDLIDTLREQVQQSHALSISSTTTTTSTKKHKRTKSLSTPTPTDENKKEFDFPSTPINKQPETSSRRRRISTEFRQRLSDLPTPLRKLSTPAPLRKLSTPSLQRKTSESKNSSPIEYIDFGACFSPDEMKSFNQVIDKLATTLRNTNNTAHRRYSNISETISHSLKEPAKKYYSLRKRRKSNEFTSRKNLDLDIFDGNNTLNESETEDKTTSTLDVSLNREKLDENLVELDDVSFSQNVWYYGEFDVDFTDIEDKDLLQAKCGTILARVDSYGDVVYSLTYRINDDIIPASFPCQNNRFCLDFTDPTQPRFTSAKFLIAYLIEQKILERVTFSWLIENCDNFC